jgi:hypothetical protein
MGSNHKNPLRMSHPNLKVGYEVTLALTSGFLGCQKFALKDGVLNSAGKLRIFVHKHKVLIYL